MQNSNSSWNSSTSAAAAVAVYRGLSSERIAATQDLSSFPAIVTVLVGLQDMNKQGAGAKSAKLKPRSVTWIYLELTTLTHVHE